ncbi:MAG: S41 family peptidase [Pseudomonadota bacterium]|nr:S41 family peptidase [Pseudomonadota bacterium]
MNTLDSHDTSATVTDRRAARSVTRSAGSVLGALLGLILTTASVSTSAQPVMDNPEAGQPTADTRPLPINEVRMFAEALEAIRSAYVQEIDDQTLIEYAIRGMLAGLDPHSAYLNANDYDSLQESTEGQFGGLGIEVGEEDGYIKVITPLDGSPADRAGVMAGDLIVEIDGRPLREMIVNDAIEMLRGEPGTTIDLTLMRNDESEPIDLTLTREVISVESVRHRMLEPGYAYLRIAQFRVNTGEEVVEALETLIENNGGPLNGMVLDLRNNPGGVLEASVAVADAFLTDGQIVYTEGRMNESNETYQATASDPSQGVPLVVLINTGSASAAEIVAGALQDQGRAVIMGTRSFGKGSVQSVLPINNERALKLTTSLYFTPSGRSIQAFGIEPDISVDEALVTRSLERRGIYSERDLEGHLPGVNENSDPEPSGPRPVTSSEQIVVSDYQLNEALTLLKGWHIMQRSRR